MSLVISIERADVEAAGGHGPGMHDGMLHHIVSQIAGSVLATAVLHRVTNEVKVFLLLYIKRWNGPVTLRLLGLLLHVEYTPLVIYYDDSRTLQLLDGGLLMTHDA